MRRLHCHKTSWKSNYNSQKSCNQSVISVLSYLEQRCWPSCRQAKNALNFCVCAVMKIFKRAIYGSHSPTHVTVAGDQRIFHDGDGGQTLEWPRGMETLIACDQLAERKRTRRALNNKINDDHASQGADAMPMHSDVTGVRFDIVLPSAEHRTVPEQVWKFS